MKINTRLKLTAGISLGTVILILLALVWSWREISSADRNMDLVDAMRKVALERIMLRDEYLLYQEARAATQWRTKTDELRALFAVAESRFPDENNRVFLHDARQDFDATVSGFSRVIASRTDHYPGQTNMGGFSDAELRQISQVLLKAYSLADNINRLHETTQAKTKGTRDNGILLVVFFFLGGVIVIVINSSVIRRTLAKRITTLVAGVEVLGSGNLDYRIILEGDDELTDLAKANNEMAARLKSSFTSLNDLQREIDERKKAEKELQRSNSELEQFAYVASHDLQEPLRMISSYTQLLADRYKDKLDDKANLFIHYAVDGAIRMQALINDLLAYSRIGTKGKTLEPVDTHVVLGEAVNVLRMSINEAKAIITNEELPEVRADASQLVLLFQNLIGNALKFRGKGYPHVQISAKDNGAEWQFSVKDNDIGIDPQFADKIFVIFQRLHTKEEYPGSGMGLAICKKIVERHGGRIWFESELDKGATFYFTIPKQ